jgi:ElaB/YqjD/DUF883 family membrane-anchored ribosome-binding protein
MDAAAGLAEQNADEMRQEINRTRSALADKLEALEDRVMDTVASAQATVHDSIQTAQDTVATVKRKLDIRYQVAQHPWGMVGGSFVVGLALGGLFPRVQRRSRQALNRLTGVETPPAGRSRLVAEQRNNGSLDTVAPVPHSMSVNRPGFFDQFQEEIDNVKGMAIGYVMGVVRDSIKEAVPQLASQIDDVMNSVTTKLGGKPVQQRSPSAADLVPKG